jgi:hypothetical protein
MSLDSNIYRPRAAPLAVDTHHHFYPPKYVAQRRQEILAMSPGYERVVDWTPLQSLAAMDEAGVDKAADKDPKKVVRET